MRTFLFRVLCISVLSVSISSEVFAQTNRLSAQQNDTLRVARATWDTGWFQTEVFRLLIQEMGYHIAPAQTMTAEEFYGAVSNGDMDFWVNGWFPLHQAAIEQYSQQERVEAVGYEVRRGAIQGYLVDISSAQTLEFESLAQLKNPDIARHFDVNGNGKADLIGCNTDWSCYNRINEHIETLGLEETVEQVSGDYNPLAREAIEKSQQGAPLLMYTWTPNWTLGEVTPGEDVRWLHVPIEGQQEISGLEGASRNPINLGYDLNDIRVVANKVFMEKHPDLRILFEELRIPLEDVQRQNAKMAEGEGSLEDIRAHALNWIEEHKEELTTILKEAGIEDPFGEEILASGSPVAGVKEESSLRGQKVRVVTQQVEPLVQYRNREYTGFSIEIFKAIADEMGLEYSIYSVNSIAKMLDDVKRGEADIATAALGITSDREEMLEFSHPYYDTGLQIMIPKKESSISTIPKAILPIIFSKEVLMIFLFFFGVLLISAHIIWFAERGRNEDFPETYWNGIGIAIWWAAVTVTTVGYGDKTPKGVPGRIFGLIWIFAGYFAFSYFTATVTSTVTLQEIEGNIRGLDDLYGREVATVSNSASEFYLAENGITPNTFNTINEAVDELIEKEVDAVVYDAPVLQHLASEDNYGKVMVTGSLFQQQSYGFALQKGSELRKEINLAYLRLVENGEYQEIRRRWFGR